jgi:hypothetical protein
MEVRLIAGEGIPAYPYWKVVVVDARAEVAEFPCTDEGAENLYYHEGLAERLRARHPELGDAGVSPGWLTQGGGEAVVRLLVNGVSPADATRIADALGDWCAAAGVDKLAIVDPSLSGDGEQEWELR